MATRVKCPICRAEVVFEGNPFRPFCSERCKLIDLGAWAGEKYRIPGATIEPDSREEDQEEEGDGRKKTS